MKAMRSLLKRLSFGLFRAGARLRVHVLPKRYPPAIPDYRWLGRNRSLWASRASLRGVHWDLDEQLRWIRDLCSPHYHEVRGLHVYRQLAASGVGAGYRPIESQVLHCFIRAMRPATVIEIGSGVATACMLHAVRLNPQEGRRGSRVDCIQ